MADDVLQSRSQSSSFDEDEQDMGVPMQVYKLTTVIGLLSFTMGIDIGLTPSLGFLIKQQYLLSNFETELYIAMIVLTGIIGAAFAWKISDQCGRTRTILIAANMKILGAILIIVGQSWIISIVGRGFSGLGYGLGYSVDSLYVSEIVPSRHRGRFISYVEFARKLGILCGILAGWFVSSTSMDNVDTMGFLGAAILVPSAILLVFTFFMPETPRWCMLVGREDQARAEIKKLVNDETEIESSIQDMREEIAESDSSWGNIMCSEDPVLNRMVYTVLRAAFLEEMSGVHIILFYTPFMLQSRGVSYHRGMMTLVIVASCLVTFIVAAMFLLDYKGFGRRRMIMASCVGTGLALIGLSVSFYLNNVAGITAMLITHACFFSFGLGPGVLLLITETIPLYARAKVISIAQVVGRTTSVVNALTFLTLIALIGEMPIFAAYAGFMITACVWAHYLPTTRGRRLESMRRIYEKK